MGASSPSRTAGLNGNPLYLHPGDELETVLLSAFCDGCLRLWRSEGTSAVRRVEEEATAVQVLGRGVIARTRSEPNRYREVGLLNANRQVLSFPERMIAKEGTSSARTVLSILSCFTCDGARVDGYPVVD
jgi:hypothetical protein